jgi:DNA-binding protein Fis
MEKEALQAYKKRLKNISNGPDLRYFLTLQKSELKESDDLRKLYVNQINFLRKNWNQDKFYKKMLDDLEFDFEYEMEHGTEERANRSTYDELVDLDDFFIDTGINLYIKSLDRHDLLNQAYLYTFQWALNICKYNKVDTANLLGVSERTIRNKEKDLEPYRNYDISFTLDRYIETDLIKLVKYELIKKLLIICRDNKDRACKYLGGYRRTLNNYIFSMKVDGWIRRKQVNKTVYYKYRRQETEFNPDYPSPLLIQKNFNEMKMIHEDRMLQAKLQRKMIREQHHVVPNEYDKELCPETKKQPQKKPKSKRKNYDSIREEQLKRAKEKAEPKHFFKYAKCHPKEFEWEDGLCFKCWKELKELNERNN